MRCGPVRRGATSSTSWGSGMSFFERSMPLFNGTAGKGRTQIEVIALTLQSPVHVQRGSLQTAKEHAAIFLPRAREIEEPQTLGPALAEAAFVAAARGETDDAVALVRELETRFPGAQTFNLHLNTVLRVCAATGELDLVERLLKDVHEWPIGTLSTNTQRTGAAILAEARGAVDEARVLYRGGGRGLACVGIRRRAGVRPVWAWSVRRRIGAARGDGDLRAARRRAVHRDRRVSSATERCCGCGGRRCPGRTVA